MTKELKQLEIDHSLFDIFVLDDSEEFTSTHFKSLLKAIPPGGQYSLTAKTSIRRMGGTKVEAAWRDTMAPLNDTGNHKDDVPSDD
ncbi:hypothetical protein [Pseudomonas tremae]|uniref:hypothetical protein n=1 Tax=Pseudomonas tremae TaxID=200454 RepID=UPI0004678F25|nr:hypothetical protein [Pseudomonas tremae]